MAGNLKMLHKKHIKASSISKNNDPTHKRSKSHHSQYASHKRVGSVAHYSINFGKQIESMSIDKDNYRVSPNEAMESESFDSRTFNKQNSLIDQKQKAMNSQASGSRLGKSPLQY